MVIAIYGAGKGGEILMESAILAGFDISHFIDDDPLRINKWITIRYQHSKKIFSKKEHNLYKKDMCIATEIFSPIVREKINREYSCVSIIHPFAFISDQSHVGTGCFIKAGAVIDGFNYIGRGCFIDNNVTIAHHNTIEDFCNICAGTTIGSSVEIGKGSIIGLNCTIQSGVTIEEGCVIPSGTVLLHDFLEKGKTYKRRLN